MEAVNAVPEHRKPELMAAMEMMNQKDTILMYNNLVAKCFQPCVNGFRSQHLGDDEAKCVKACGEKFLKCSQRVGFRFAELSAQQQAEAAAGGR